MPESIPDFSDVSLYRDFFHKAVNIEIFPEFRVIAEELSRYFLSQADYGAVDERDEEGNPILDEEGNFVGNYRQFNYTPEAFNERMTKIYKDLEEGMFEPSVFDSGLLIYPATVGENEGEPIIENRTYNVGPFSRNVLKERLIQVAPFNLLDGVWLQNIQPAIPSDSVRSRLFSIWADEAGNGEVEQNHANVYDALLKSEDIYLPAVTSRAFIEYPGFLDEAFINPVFQAVVGMFPEKFFPELLGMTLYLEWEGTPILYSTVKSFERRGIDPTFYSLHVAIDNIGQGHGSLAKEAIELYLADKQEEGGDIAVQEAWNRIWNGYVTWATLSTFGRKFIERALTIDRKQINIDLRDPNNPNCFPDLNNSVRERMISLVKSRAEIADTVHRAVNVGGQSLSNLFSEPERLLDSLVDAGYVDPEHPRDSKFIRLLDFDGPMYKIFDRKDIDTILDWIESLRVTNPTCTNPIIVPEPGSEPIEVKMLNLLARNEGIGSVSHRGISLPVSDGTTRTINELFENIPLLMEAMVLGGWVTPGSLEDSVFYTRLITNNGPMSGFFSRPDELKIAEDWILDGAKIPSQGIITPLIATNSSENISDELISEISSTNLAQFPTTFAKLRPIVGMGSVH